MESLFTIALNCVINNNIQYNIYKLPIEINNIIAPLIIKKQCNNVASNTIADLTNGTKDLYGRYTNGIMVVLRKKFHVWTCGKIYERARRNCIINAPMLKCLLVLYYLKQEPDFTSWHND
jgi:hypothetical protein